MRIHPWASGGLTWRMLILSLDVAIYLPNKAQSSGPFARYSGSVFSRIRGTPINEEKERESTGECQPYHTYHGKTGDKVWSWQ